MNEAVPRPVNPTADSPVTKATSSRRTKLWALGLLVLLGGCGYGVWWYLLGRNVQSTDDAYVNGDVVQITSEIPGTVVVLRADDTQYVNTNQTLLELDPADARVAMSNAEANLGKAVRQVRARFAQANQLRAQILDREIALKRAQDDNARRVGLLNDGAISSEELAHTDDTITETRAVLTAAREQLNATTAEIDNTTISTNPQVLAAAAAVRDAALALRRATITTPVAGIIARRSVQIGQRVAPGTPLMGVVSLDALWVDANFKEVQLQHMRIGQAVTLRADLYGGNAVYHGKLVGLSAGSGTAFALLPAQNASGNWIKIVQRVPVRIALDPRELAAHPLRIGLSMTAEVDIRDTSGPQFAREVRNVPIPAQPGLGDDTAAEAQIARIIGDNSGKLQGTSERTAANRTF